MALEGVGEEDKEEEEEEDIDNRLSYKPRVYKPRDNDSNNKGSTLSSSLNAK